LLLLREPERGAVVPDKMQGIQRACGFCSIVVAALSVAVACFLSTSQSAAAYRIRTAYQAFRSLHAIPAEEFEAFMASFGIFERSDGNWYVNATSDYEGVKDYYRVLNRLCSLGSVEKMYIPPILDPSQGVFENQLIFEKGFADELGVGPGKLVLDMGCGRGRVAHTVASHTGAKVIGLNIEPNQLQEGRRYARETGLLGTQLEFIEANFNDPLPFPDNHFDAFYQVQVMTYSKDLKSVFREIFRVLKPGAKMSVLDGVMLDGYNSSDPAHRQLLNETRQVTGFGGFWHTDVWRQAVEESGFTVLFHGDKSIGGHQYPLIEQESQLFDKWMWALKLACRIGLLPPQLEALMLRFNLHKESFMEMDKRGMLTTSWHILAQKIIQPRSGEHS